MGGGHSLQAEGLPQANQGLKVGHKSCARAEPQTAVAPEGCARSVSCVSCRLQVNKQRRAPQGPVSSSSTLVSKGGGGSQLLLNTHKSEDAGKLPDAENS